MLLVGQDKLRQPGAGLWNTNMAETFQNIGLLEPELPIKVFVWQRLLESILISRSYVPGVIHDRKRPFANLFPPENRPWNVRVRPRPIRRRGREFSLRAAHKTEAAKEVLSRCGVLPEPLDVIKVGAGVGIVVRHD